MEYVTAIRPITYETVSETVNALTARYRFLRAAPIGNSVENRRLWGLTMGNGEERVLIAAAFHGLESVTAWIALRLCEEICYAWDSGKPLAGWEIYRVMQDRSVTIVPLVNPDGVHRAQTQFWQANANGVDLNHNFNAGWEVLQQEERKNGITGPCARQWGGPAPESEPETAALVALCERLPFRHVVALHSQGEEIYWQYGDHTPAQSLLMAKAMASTSGYAVSSPSGLASHGGFKDWFIETYHRPGFTIELGKGCNPLPMEIWESIYQKAREMLLISAFL